MELTKEEEDAVWEMRSMEVKKLQERLGVSDEDVFRMVETLVKAGFGKSAFAFLCQSGQTYSFTFDEYQARAFEVGEDPAQFDDIPV